MNAVEIEEAISALAEQPFDPAEFPFAFLQAFGNKETTIKRLRAGASNKSDLGGVLQTNNIHIAVCPPGEVTKTLAALKASPATAKAKAKFILATDGADFEAEDLDVAARPSPAPIADFPDHFGFFLPLAGITTVRQIRESSFDIRATSRLNRLYVELLKDNPEWGTAERRHDMNHFMARLIFCYLACSCRALLEPLDHQGLLSGTVAKPAAEPDEMDDDALLAELGVDAATADITELRHVRSSADKRAAEEIANRQPCADFDAFKPLFQQVQQELEAGIRQTRPFELKAEIRPGSWFIVGGQKAYVAEMGEIFSNAQGRTDARLRVIFDNGTREQPAYALPPKSAA